METLIEMAKRAAYLTDLDKNDGWKQCLVFCFFNLNDFCKCVLASFVQPLHPFVERGHLFAQRLYCGGRCMQQLHCMPIPDKLLVHVDIWIWTSISIPYISILTRVLLCARLNVVCGPGAGLGYGVMSVERHGYPWSPRRYPSNYPATEYKL